MSNMKQRCETMVIEAKNYSTYEDYKKAIIDVIDTLITNDYIVVAKQEIKDTIILEYNHKDFNLSEYWNAWVSIDEYIDDINNADSAESELTC